MAAKWRDGEGAGGMPAYPPPACLVPMMPHLLDLAAHCLQLLLQRICLVHLLAQLFLGCVILASQHVRLVGQRVTLLAHRLRLRLQRLHLRRCANPYALQSRRQNAHVTLAQGSLHAALQD